METSHPISRISDLCGFNDPERMAVVFKRLTGKPPSRFRREQTGSFLVSQKFDKLSKIMTIVVEGAATDEVAIDYAGFVDEGPPQISRSNLHLGTVAMRRPMTRSARAGISTLWQTLAIGRFCRKAIE